MAILGDSSKAFIRKCSAKKLILIISQISQENTLPYCYLGCIMAIFKGRRPEVFYKMGVLKKLFTNFTVSHMC